MHLRHLPCALALTCSIALAQSFTPIREQKNLSPAAIAKLHTVEMLNSLPVGEWHFHSGDVPHGESPSLDDSAWPLQKPRAKAPQDAVWYRRVIEVPKTLNGYDLTGSRIWFQFRADANGFINGIRFYKPAGAQGTHTGVLWDNNGQRLASAAFSNESASGWQQVTFAAPVPISADTTYVVSYRSVAGRYVATTGGLTTAVSNGPLQALLARRNHLHLLTPARASRRLPQDPCPARPLVHFRQAVETLNSQLAEQFGVERNRAKSVPGLCARIVAKRIVDELEPV